MPPLRRRKGDIPALVSHFVEKYATTYNKPVRQLGPGTLNALLAPRGLVACCRPTRAATRLLAAAGERLGLSARGFHRVLRVARTIADLAGDERVGEEALAEALRHRGEVGL